MESDTKSKYGFYDGQKLSSVTIGGFRISARPKPIGTSWEENEYSCKDITVVTENGQMAGVPWAVVEYGNGQVDKYNLALATGVTL